MRTNRLPENENVNVASEEAEEVVWLKSACCPVTFQRPVYFMLASWSSTMKKLLMKECVGRKKSRGVGALKLNETETVFLLSAEYYGRSIDFFGRFEFRMSPKSIYDMYTVYSSCILKSWPP